MYLIKNKRVIWALILLVTVSVFISACSDEKAGKAVAKVNDENITEDELEKYVDYRKKEAELSGYIAPEMWGQVIEGSEFTYEQQLKQSSLQDLINQRVLLQKADEEEIEVTNKELDKELEEFRNTEEKEKNFNDYLDQLGISEEYFEEMYKQGMTINKLMDKLVKIDEKSVKEEYEANKESYDKIKASHILVETKEEAEEVKNKIKEGEDFAELAKEYSTDPSAEQNAGDLGFFGKDANLVPEFKDAAFELKKGEVSGPVKSEYGYHIIKVTDEKKGLEANEEEIKENLKGEKFNERAQELIEEADTEILIDFEKEAEKNKEDNADENSEEENQDDKNDNNSEESQNQDENKENKEQESE